MSPSNTSIVCPQCQQIDMVQKVSSIYTSGTSSTKTTGSSVGVGVPLGKGSSATVMPMFHSMQGTNQSYLSARLSPPPQPARPPLWLQVLLILGSLLLGAPCVCCGTGVGGAELSNLALSGNFSQSSGQMALGSFVVAGLLLVGAIVVSVAMYRPKKKQYDANMADRQIAVAKWNQLYYCARDDLVFDPGASLSFAPEAMNSYLVNFVQAYKQQAQPAIDVTPQQERAVASSATSALPQAKPFALPEDTQTNAEKLQQALDYLKAGNQAGAYLTANEMIRNDPNDYQGWVVLAQAAPSKEEAIKSLEKALELKPDDERIKKHLSELRG
jgi:hypothetical protein